MRVAFAVCVLSLAALISSGLTAGDKKEAKTAVLKGTITCAKCDLGKADACATVIVVKNDKKKDVVYWFDKAGHDKHHSAVCTEAKAGTVKGVVEKMGDKNVIVVKELEFKK